MKKLILVLAVIAMFGFTSYAQSKSDVCEGNFSCPSYQQEELSNYSNYSSYSIEFSDGVSGRLFYKKKCGKYYVEQCSTDFSCAFYYSDFSTAIKALYAYKKYGCTMEGTVSCY